MKNWNLSFLLFFWGHNCQELMSVPLESPNLTMVHIRSEQRPNSSFRDTASTYPFSAFTKSPIHWQS